jgi:hypothetical protein
MSTREVVVVFSSKLKIESETRAVNTCAKVKSGTVKRG